MLSPALADAEWRLVVDLVEERFGLAFHGVRRELLAARLRPRLRELGLRGWAAYAHYLMFHPERAGEDRRLRQVVTNNETYFFREAHQLDVLARHVAPAHLARRPGAALRVLSAGCSSGEEPYSIAITLAAAGVPRAVVDGFDLDPARVAQAREAEYDEGSLRACSPAQREQYFEARPRGRWALRGEHRRGVEVFEHNLVGPRLGRPRYDAIFCRNVLIYLAEAALERAVGRLVDCLDDAGVLFLGHAESLIQRTGDLEPVLLGGHVAYRRARGPA